MDHGHHFGPSKRLIGHEPNRKVPTMPPVPRNPADSTRLLGRCTCDFCKSATVSHEINNRLHGTPHSVNGPLNPMKLIPTHWETVQGTISQAKTVISPFRGRFHLVQRSLGRVKSLSHLVGITSRNH